MFYKECGILTLKNYTTYSQKLKNKKKACLPTKHMEGHMNSFKRVRAFQIELEFGSVGFWGEGKPEYPEKNLSEQRGEPTTNSTHIWRQRRDLNPGHIGGRWALPLLRHPCSPTYLFWAWKRNSFRAGPPSPRIGIMASFPSGP